MLDSTINYKVSTQKLIYKNSYIVWIKTSVPFRHYCNFEMKKKMILSKAFFKNVQRKRYNIFYVYIFIVWLENKIRSTPLDTGSDSKFSKVSYFNQCKIGICIMLSFKNWIRNWNYFWNRKMQRRDIQV